MATFSMTGSIQFTPKLVDGRATLTDPFSSVLDLSNGTDEGQADGFWSGTLTIPAGNSETLDLTALALSAFGASGTLYFASVKHLAVVNQSANVSLAVEPGASNGWGEFGGTTVGKSGTLVIYSPVVGLPVGGTSKTITITNDGSVATLTGNTTSASATVSGLSSTTGLAAGMNVTGTGIPTGTQIASITNGTSLVLTANATATGTGVSLNFAWPDAVVKVCVAGVLD